MRRLPLILSALSMAAATPAHAQTSQDEQVWLNLTAMGSVKGDLVYLAEIQPRVGDGVSRVNQAIFRGALGWSMPV